MSSRKQFPQYLEKRHYMWFRDNISKNIHPRSECQKSVSPDITLEQFKCCPLWQRKLSNKWNSRILAEKLCIPVPDLYWHGMGKDIDKIPFDTFPEC